MTIIKLYYYTSAGVDISKPLDIMCGGRMVLLLVSFALSLIGTIAAVYDA